CSASGSPHARPGRCARRWRKGPRGTGWLARSSPGATAWPACCAAATPRPRRRRPPRRPRRPRPTWPPTWPPPPAPPAPFPTRVGPAEAAAALRGLARAQGATPELLARLGVAEVCLGRAASALDAVAPLLRRGAPDGPKLLFDEISRRLASRGLAA